MPTRNSTAGRAFGADPVTTTTTNGLPGGMLAYTTGTPMTGITAVVNLTGMSLTITPPTNRDLKITVLMHAYISSALTSGDTFQVQLQRDGVTGQIWIMRCDQQNVQVTLCGYAFDFQTDGNPHTYLLRGGRLGGTGTYAAIANGTALGVTLTSWFAIEDVGVHF